MFGRNIIRSHQPVRRRGCRVIVAAQWSKRRRTLAALSHAVSLVAAETRCRLHYLRHV